LSKLEKINEESDKSLRY